MSKLDDGCTDGFWAIEILCFPGFLGARSQLAGERQPVMLDVRLMQSMSVSCSVIVALLRSYKTTCRGRANFL
jgi:hypothetical protein